MLKSSLILLIKFYQKLISPLLPKSCRYYPSCSEYSRQSLIRYGVAKGLKLTLFRVCKCNPFCVGGYDPVP